FEPARRRKWIEISVRYPQMTAEKQQLLQKRMAEWTSLSPEQRRVARDSYVRMQPLSPEKRANVLQQYQDLSPETREQLTAQAKAQKSLLHARAQTNPPAAIPTKAQISEGSRQRVPMPPDVAKAAVPEAQPSGPSAAQPATPSAASVAPVAAS